MNPLISFVVPAAAVGQPLTQTGSPGLPAHPFVCTDYTQGEVFVIYRSGESEWSYPAERCNDIWSLPNGNLSVQHGQRRERSHAGRSRWYSTTNRRVKSTRVNDCRTETRLSGNATPARSWKSRRKGEIVKRDPAAPGWGSMAVMRLCETHANSGTGTTLSAHYGLDKVREYDSRRQG